MTLPDCCAPPSRPWSPQRLGHAVPVAVRLQRRHQRRRRPAAGRRAAAGRLRDPRPAPRRGGGVPPAAAGAALRGAAPAPGATGSTGAGWSSSSTCCAPAVLVALTVTIATGVVDIGLVLATMFVLGTAETLADIAGSALLVETVERADLGVANARLQGGFITANQLMGPPLGRAALRRGPAAALRRHRGLRRRRRRARHPRDAAPAARPRPQPPAAPGRRRGHGLAVAPPGGAHPDADHRAVQRHLRRRLVGAGPLRPGAARARRRRLRLADLLHRGRRTGRHRGVRLARAHRRHGRA